jgi:hypothetical protein
MRNQTSRIGAAFAGLLMLTLGACQNPISVQSQCSQMTRVCYDSIQSEVRESGGPVVTGVVGILPNGQVIAQGWGAGRGTGQGVAEAVTSASISGVFGALGSIGAAAVQRPDNTDIRLSVGDVTSRSNAQGGKATSLAHSDAAARAAGGQGGSVFEKISNVNTNINPNTNVVGSPGAQTATCVSCRSQ